VPASTFAGLRQTSASNSIILAVLPFKLLGDGLREGHSTREAESANPRKLVKLAGAAGTGV
jgi:hypothetical protein